MIHIPCEQGSREWLDARAGVVTASALDRLLTKKTLKASEQATKYLHRLLAEFFLGRSLEDDEAGGSGWATRGSVMEAEAWSFYSMEREVEIEEVGFLKRDDGLFGASPDGLVGTDGGVEIKVPSAETHFGNLDDPDGFVESHRGQVQGSLLLTGRKWWDLLSFNPEMPHVLVRVLPDEKYLAALRPVLEAFLVRLGEARAKWQPVKDALRASNPFL